MSRFFSPKEQINEEEKSEPLKDKSIINFEKISKSEAEKHALLKRRSGEFLNEDPKVFHSYKKRIVGNPFFFFILKNKYIFALGITLNLLFFLDMNTAITKNIFINECSELICSICMEIIINANNTICGHTFCNRCINECLLYSQV